MSVKTKLLKKILSSASISVGISVISSTTTFAVDTPNGRALNNATIGFLTDTAGSNTWNYIDTTGVATGVTASAPANGMSELGILIQVLQHSMLMLLMLLLEHKMHMAVASVF